MNLQDLRQDYALRSLDTSDVSPNPIEQFNIWMREALDAQLDEPNAMTLATVSAEGKPSGRVVLLKEISPEGDFVFYTNYQSKKADDLAANPNCALVFLWLGLQRQVRIDGVASFNSRQQSEEYFVSRPKGSQIGAWASPQSKVIASRNELEMRQAELEAQYADTDTLPLPAHWGGYAVKPMRIEFWQGRQSRLHDRVCYTRQADGSWLIERLAP